MLCHAVLCAVCCVLRWAVCAVCAALCSECGIMPRAVRDLFEGAAASREAGATVTVTMSFLQIYIERITDLLAPPSDVPTTRNFTLPIREDPTYGVFVDGLTAVRVESVADVLRMVRVGAANRATSSTHQNMASSRSHAMLMFTLEQTQPADEAASPTQNATTAELRRSTLRIVDLAGSERVSKSGSDVRTGCHYSIILPHAHLHA